MGMSEMALGAVMKCSPFRYRKLMAKNMAEEWMAWSLKAARNWAISRPMNVRERNEEAGSNADMRTSSERAGGLVKKPIVASRPLERNPQVVVILLVPSRMRSRSPYGCHRFARKSGYKSQKIILIKDCENTGRVVSFGFHPPLPTRRRASTPVILLHQPALSLAIAPPP